MTITNECIWPNGKRFRRIVPCRSSTSAGCAMLVGAARAEHPGSFEEEPMLFRVYLDDALVLEFDYQLQRYNLCLEFPIGHEFRVPKFNVERWKP